MPARNQVTCSCSSYPFPHRIGGGACSGSMWAESYRQVDGSACHGCNCLNRGSCDVQNGTESITFCEGYQDHLHTQSPLRLPASIESLFDFEDQRFGWGAY
uniref:Uncharacterized protein n=1 Tax=uncultured Thiotrichaceae bacterium TaxID=298394 RepID=A0A6S6UE96_9GAMM|nr:MAG: Unknown protein [uncultured Thiotrichaceae bacterium]